MKYRCTKQLLLDSYDDDGFLTEESSEFVEPGEVFEHDETDFRCVGGSETVRLTQDGQCWRWLEILPETLHEYFEEIIAE